MEKRKMTAYDAGYSRADMLKKLAVTASAAAILGGGLTACGNSVAGDMQYYPDDLDGSMVVQAVSGSDVSQSDVAVKEVYVTDAQTSGNVDSSDDEELFTLDGDIAYVP